MNLDNPSHLDPYSRDNIVSSYRSIRDVPPSTTDEILALGCPSMENILEKDGIVISYNPGYKVANIVCELLTHDQWSGRYLTRKDAVSFYEDLSINSAERATDDDYKESGYTRGHLAPASDQAYNFNAYTATYCLSNIVPMFTNVNNIINVMEREGRSLAKEKEKVYIYTGPVFYPNRMPIYTKQGSGVRVPDSIFKVIVHTERNCNKKFVRGYEVENSDSAIYKDIRDWMQKLPEINSKTGLKILGDVDKNEIVDVFLNQPPKIRRRSRNIGC